MAGVLHLDSGQVSWVRGASAKVGHFAQQSLDVLRSCSTSGDTKNPANGGHQESGQWTTAKFASSRPIKRANARRSFGLGNSVPKPLGFDALGPECLRPPPYRNVACDHTILMLRELPYPLAGFEVSLIGRIASVPPRAR